MDKEKTFQQEKVWNKVAEQWSKYRCTPLPEVKNFLKNKEGRILDLCCGSGRNFIKIKGDYYGVDFSDEMLKYAKENAKKIGITAIIKKAEADKLPFEDNFFDAAIFVAALQCIESEQKREKTILELNRVLKPGAEAIISVWDKSQEQFAESPKEIFIPWRVKDKEYPRYYYLYDKNELVNLLKIAGFEIKEIIEGFKGSYSKKNIVIIARKRKK